MLAETIEIHKLNPLFEDVQLSSIFSDSKTFPDCLPKRSLEEIERDYKDQKTNAGFDLSSFVNQNFRLPEAFASDFSSDQNNSVQLHIEKLWPVLTRQPEEVISSLISLPYPYVVPGGRFGEIYYWDSYFTMLGLRISSQNDLIQNMVDNFAFLIDRVGYIPNGNRTYYLGRSQPPFFSLMADLLSKVKGRGVLEKYLQQLEKEYSFWMRGKESLNSKNNTNARVVWLPDGAILNRYWDESDTPRPEAFKEDIELAHHSKKPGELYRHIRAAAESGWDFSCRWFTDPKSFESIHTTEIIPIDLNCLLLFQEELLAEVFQNKGDTEKSIQYKDFASKRKEAIQKYCWNEKEGFYFDYDFINSQTTHSYNLAAAFPLFFKVASPQQAFKVCNQLETKFLKQGGLITTLLTTGQQWDAPNGWAPLQWIAYIGCKNYGQQELAAKIKKAWLQTNNQVYQNTGKMMEKYNVMGIGDAGGGGEYPNQDGFGWTNGVYLALIDSE